MLKTHGRYDYSAITKRADYSWPGGKRLAVHLCLNIEHFAFGEGLGNDYSTTQPQPNVRSFAWRDYGNRVGGWRLLEFANQYDIPYAILLNSELYDYCPELLAAFAERGDEMVGHGRTNSERQTDMKPEEERRAIFEVAEKIEKHWGKRPMGWLAPYISETLESPEYLKEAGFRYIMDWSMDDQPVWFRTKHGPMLSVPYAHDLNDSIEIVTRKTPQQLFCDSLIDQFDEMLDESARRPLVLPLVLHTFVLGVPHRLRQYRRVIEHILKHHDKIWLTRPGDICKYIESLPAGVVPGSK